jgi:hypothetical protein
MTGIQLKDLREQVGMTIPNFSTLLGVHVGTVYRWEAAGGGQLNFDPLHERIIAHMNCEAAAKSLNARTKWGNDLVQALLIGGTLFALAKLLSSVTNKPTRRRSPQSRKRKSS